MTKRSFTLFSAVEAKSKALLDEIVPFFSGNDLVVRGVERSGTVCSLGDGLICRYFEQEQKNLTKELKPDERCRGI
jgi:hypothetical protein